MSEKESNIIEIKNIFNLFQPQNGEVDIQNVNQIIKKIDSLPFQKQTLIKKHQQDNVQDKKKKKNQSQEIDNEHIDQDNGQKKQEVCKIMELKYFPDYKSKLSFEDFQDIYNECMNNKEIHDELLQQCFSKIDYNQDGFIDPKKIQEIFEAFSEDMNIDDINNVLKFSGLKENMNQEDFNEFFKKNL